MQKHKITFVNLMFSIKYQKQVSNQLKFLGFYNLFYYSNPKLFPTLPVKNPT